MSQRSTLRNVVGVAAVFAVVWGVALFYWKSIYRVPSVQDLALVGVALPVLLIAAFVGVRKAIAATRPPAPAPTARAPRAGGTAASSIADDESFQWTLALLDSSLHLPAGHTADEIGAAAREGKVVGLHAELKLTDQTRVFASDVASVSLDDFDQSLLDAEAAAELADEHRRALILAARALDDLMERHAVAAVPGHEDTRPDLPPFELHLLVPERWQQVAPTLANWLDMRLAREQWSPSVTHARVQIVANPAQALAALDNLNVTLNRDLSPARHIVLACDSQLSQSEVNALESAGQLYGRNRLDGHVPGEGACALLLALQSENAALPVARIHRVRVAERPILAGQAEEMSSAREDTIVDLLGSARTQTAPSGWQMKNCTLVSDASQRSPARTEITTAAEIAWSGLDAQSRCQHLGLANGESGAVLALSAVAMAGMHCIDELQPAFAVSVAAPLARAAVFVSPPVPAPVETSEASEAVAA